MPPSLSPTLSPSLSPTISPTDAPVPLTPDEPTSIPTPYYNDQDPTPRPTKYHDYTTSRPTKNNANIVWKGDEWKGEEWNDDGHMPVGEWNSSNWNYEHFPDPCPISGKSSKRGKRSKSDGCSSKSSKRGKSQSRRGKSEKSKSGKSKSGKSTTGKSSKSGKSTKEDTVIYQWIGMPPPESVWTSGYNMRTVDQALPTGIANSTVGDGENV